MVASRTSGPFAARIEPLRPRPSRPSPLTSHPPVREPKVTVKIPRPLYRKIQQVVEDSGFNSPTDFIVYVLRDLMGEADEEKKPEFTQDELDDVKRKLKNLGYL
jgi:Arc/MetJ-type ribon-helix-helix transcriptional regulator